MSNSYPLSHTDDDLKKNAVELSSRILSHNHRTDNFENLIRDSVLFNVTYIELQNRASKKTTSQMVLLTWISALVALASLVVAVLSYKASTSGDDWQVKQLKLLSTIADQTKPISVPAQGVKITVPTSKQPKSTTK